MKMISSKQRKQIIEFLKKTGRAVDVLFQQNGVVCCRYNSRDSLYFAGWEDQLIKKVEACKTEKR